MANNITNKMLRDLAWHSEDRKIIEMCLTKRDTLAFENVCANPNLSEEDIRNIYSEFKDLKTTMALRYVLARLASNPATPKDIFDELCEHEYPWVAREAASSKNLTAEQAKKFMKYSVLDVRTMLAYNSFLNSEVLTEYANIILHSEDYFAHDILNALVRNKSLPMKMVRKICDYDHDHVSQALYNPALDEKTIVFIYRNINLSDMDKTHLLMHKKCPEWILEAEFEEEKDLDKKKEILIYMKRSGHLDLYRTSAIEYIEIECEMLKNRISKEEKK